ncbi:MAG: Hint domain-containing protein, partial [Mycobacteriaceae bacterium]|nr:Hint domain-containing protein [Mycobacteriaceae bacterium]
MDGALTLMPHRAVVGRSGLVLFGLASVADQTAADLATASTVTLMTGMQNAAGPADTAMIYTVGDGQSVQAGPPATGGIEADFIGTTGTLVLNGVSGGLTIDVTGNGAGYTGSLDLTNVSLSGPASAPTQIAPNVYEIDYSLTDTSGTTSSLALRLHTGGGQYTISSGPDPAGTGLLLTDTQMPCFVEGTLIATPEGGRPVEWLRVGDLVCLAAGGHAPVKWLGHRTVRCARHSRPQDVWPVRVRAHAFGPDQPMRDLWLSPDHALCIDGSLVPVRCLLNGATVVQERCERVTYWHVELPRHGVLLAEGLPAESYLDTGNRCAFVEGGVVMARPDFSRAVWAREGCAPLALQGPVVAAARRRLLRRLPSLGWRVTEDPDLRFQVGRRDVAARWDGEWAVLALGARGGVL